jgi:hypothetical protein
LLEENEKECIGALADNMDVILKSYCNDHCASFYVQKLQSGEPDVTPNNGIESKKVSSSDFSMGASSAVKSKEEKKAVPPKKHPVIIEHAKEEDGGNGFCS